MIFGAYYVGKVHNKLPWWYYDNGSIFVGKVHNMLARLYYDIRSILCR